MPTRQYLENHGIDHFDLVIGSDLIYLADTFPLLIETLEELTKDKRTEVILCNTDHGNLGSFHH